MVHVSSALADFNGGSKFTVSANVHVLPGAIFAYHAPRYRELGYSPIPAFESGVWPKEWSKYCDAPASADQIERWGKAHNSNITLACGYGGLVVIDADMKDAAMLAAALKALPQCRIGRFGSKGFALLCRHLDPGVASGTKRFKSIYWADPNISEPIVEIKASGQNIHVPPSVHRKTGKLYTWINPETGATIIDPATGAPRLYPPALEDLPVIDDEDIERLRAALARWARQPRQPSPRSNGFDHTKIHRDRYEAWYRTALTNNASDLAGMSSGRPTKLFSASCAIGAGVHHRFLSRSEFEDAFLSACETNGLAARVGRNAILDSISNGLDRAENDELPDLGKIKPRRSKPKRKPNGSEDGGGDNGGGGDDGGDDGGGGGGIDEGGDDPICQPKASERPEFFAPNPDGELTPIMNLLDKALLTDEAIPPMRSILGWPVDVELREPAGFHELTAAGSNDDEAEDSRLPPPKSYVLARHNAHTLSRLLELDQRISTVIPSSC